MYCISVGHDKILEEAFKANRNCCFNIMYVYCGLVTLCAVGKHKNVKIKQARYQNIVSNTET